MIAAENVQRKEAIVLVVAVKEPAQLMAVDGVVGGVEIQDDLIQRQGMGLEEQLDEEVLYGSRATDHLFVPAILVGPDRGKFQTVESALAGQGLALVALADS